MITPRDPVPTGLWSGEDVWIIGGGPSLKDFDFSLLEEVKTIGINGAFALGPVVCDCIIFGDTKFYAKYLDDLRRFAGFVYTNAPLLFECDAKNIRLLPRMEKGLHSNALGWNMNTGASAINLAIILGARRIFLLGFDMRLSPTRETNWHELGLDNGKDEVYDRFLRGFADVKRDWKAKFSEVEIANVNDDTDLKVFPIISAAQGLALLEGVKDDAHNRNKSKKTSSSRRFRPRRIRRVH